MCGAPGSGAACTFLVEGGGRLAESVRDHCELVHLSRKVEDEMPESDFVHGQIEPLISGDPDLDSAPSRKQQFWEIRTKPEPEPTKTTGSHKPIFVSHGRNRAPLQQIQTLLSSFQIPHKMVVDEGNPKRPISQKVREILQECGSAILIFTRDQQFFDSEGTEFWLPSENVVHELGAASFLYGDRIVIFKEKGIHFPTAFQSIGCIEFESNDIQARTADLLKELIGFGLVRVMPT